MISVIEEGWGSLEWDRPTAPHSRLDQDQSRTIAGPDQDGSKTTASIKVRNYNYLAGKRLLLLRSHSDSWAGGRLQGFWRCLDVVVIQRSVDTRQGSTGWEVFPTASRHSLCSALLYIYVLLHLLEASQDRNVWLWMSRICCVWKCQTVFNHLKSWAT